MAVHIHNVATGVDHHASRRYLPQQGLFHQLAQWLLAGLFGVRRAVQYPRLGGREHGLNGAAQRCALRALQVFLALVNFGLAVEHRKQAVKFADAFGAAQKQMAARQQSVVKQRDQPLLQIRREVNQQVAAADQV